MNSPYVLLTALAITGATTAVATAQQPETLSLDQAVARALGRNPSVAAAAAQSVAAHGAAAQAAAWPQPELSLEVKNFAGGYNGFDDAELSLWFSQPFEIGGRRGARTAAARALAGAAAFDARRDSLELRAETRRRYAGVAHAEERLRIALRAVSVVEELLAAAETRVSSGAAPLSDRALAAAALARARIDATAARSGQRVSRAALASLWGEATFEEAIIPLDAADLPTLSADSATAWAAGSPAVMRSRLATDALRAEHALERSLRVPVLNASVGVRRIESDDATTFLAGLSLPLPLWDRRAQSIGAAEARARASQSITRQHQVDTSRRLADAIESLNRLLDQVRVTNETVVPRLADAAGALHTAYRAGGTSYPDLLEVQRALIATENENNDALRAIAEEIATIEQLTGRTIEELSHE